MTKEFIDVVQQQDATCPRGHSVRIVWIAEKGRFAFTCDLCAETSPYAICGEYWIEIGKRKRVQ